ncbi:hypothetical protein D3C80_2151180 [compost metagenome]
MQQGHLDHALNIHFIAGIRGQAQSRNGKVPTVLGRVFLTLGAHHLGTALHAFKFVDFHQKLDGLSHGAKV